MHLEAREFRLTKHALARMAERFPEADILTLPAHEAIAADPKRLIEATLTLERHVHQNRQIAAQPSGDRLTVLTPPGPGLSGKTLDALYALKGLLR